jgi:hypothetical protein
MAKSSPMRGQMEKQPSLEPGSHKERKLFRYVKVEFEWDTGFGTVFDVIAVVAINNDQTFIYNIDTPGAQPKDRFWTCIEEAAIDIAWDFVRGVQNSKTAGCSKFSAPASTRAGKNITAIRRNGNA